MMHTFNIFHEPADTDDPRVPIGTMDADTMAEALERAAQYFEIPAHDLVAVQVTVSGKPMLTIDLHAPEGNVFVLLALAVETLNAFGLKEQGAELRKRFYEKASDQEHKTTYQDMRNLVAEYCFVTWINE